MSISFASGTESIRTAGSFSELSVGSVCVWFRPHSVSGSNRIIGTDGYWECRLRGSDMKHKFRRSTQPNMTTVFAVNNWYHLVFTFDGVNKGAYVNGQADPAWGSYANGTPGSDTILSVGTSTWRASEGMDGELEDLRIYNRVLSQKDAEMIHAANGQDGLLNGLQHWWRLDQGSEGSTVVHESDFVGKVHLSTIVGSPTYTKSPRRFTRRAV